VVGITVLAVIGLVVVNLVVVVLLRSYLVKGIDDELNARGNFGDRGPGPSGQNAAANPGGLTPGLGAFPSPAPTQTDETRPALPSLFWRITLDASGKVIPSASQTGSLADSLHGPQVTGLTAAVVAQKRGQIFTLQAVGGGSDYRVLARVDANGDGLTQVVAISLAGVDSTVTRLALYTTAVSLVVVLLLFLLARVVVRVGLKPLEAVEDTAEAIAAGDLSRRVPDGPPGTEVGRLSTSLNAMLGQIESSFSAREAGERRLRRFVADAGHELRTPLTSIRGYAELFRQGAISEPEAQARAMGRIESEAERMGHLVDDLLLLARLDQQRPLERAAVDLKAVARDAVTDARVRDPGRPITFDAPEADVTVTGDPDRLRQVLDNLLGNALVHTASGTPVHLSLAILASGQVDLAVADEGPGLTVEQAARVFERFYRVDSARSRNHGGSGLGLSIVEAVATAHSGSVRCASEPGMGTTFTITLPARAPEEKREPSSRAPAPV
jgi:two-component system, OmpR family, sensor kinase